MVECHAILGDAMKITNYRDISIFRHVLEYHKDNCIRKNYEKYLIEQRKKIFALRLRPGLTLMIVD